METRRKDTVSNTGLNKNKRWSLLPVFIIDGYIDWIIHQGSIITAMFNEFVRDRVLPHCTPYASGGPRSMIVMDNCKIHWSPELKDMCQQGGVRLEYLPPYSPDLNPIETSFAVFKAWMRRYHDIAELYLTDNPYGGEFIKIGSTGSR
jgi:hypothetical protein